MLEEQNGYSLEEIAEAAELFPSLWVQKYNIRNENGIPLDFKKRPFLKEIYDDLSPKQVILKPPQVGMTVCNTLKALYVAKKLGRQIIYTLPTQGDVHDMVGGSINRIIAQNPILMNWVKEHDTVEQKTVGNSMVFYRGTFTAKQAMMIPSGLNIHDEVDASDANVITQYETRLQAQEDGGWRWYFSHPSLAGHGVDIYWQQSDKKEWLITCGICTAEQILTWPDNIDKERKVYICSTCKGTLQDKDRIRGRWKDTAQGEFSGHHISQMMLHNKTAEHILEAFHDPMKDEQYFYNYVLGLPYVGSENKIDSLTVLKNVNDKTNLQEGTVIIGVDTGLPTYYTVMNQQGVFHYGKLKDASLGIDPYLELESFLKRWPRSIIVADQGGDLSPMRILQGKYPGRVFLVWYRKDKKSNEVSKWGDGKDYGTILVDRNRMIQLIVEQMRDTGRIRLNGRVEDWKEWASHFDNIYRVKKETPFGAEYTWERNGPDHYVHSLLYAMVGVDKYGKSMATVVGMDSFDGLPVGRIFTD